MNRIIKFIRKLRINMFFLLIIIISVFLSGCMTLQEMEMLRNDINRLQTENTNLKAEIEKIKDKPGIGTASEESFNAIRKSQAELRSELSGVIKDLQMLRGKYEENKEYTEKKLRDTSIELDLLRAQANTYENQIKELKNRLNALENLANIQKESSRETPKQAEKKQEESRKEQVTGHEEQVPKTEIATAKTAKARYDAAYNTFIKDKKYKESREMFEAFIKDFPKDQLAENAYFWIGETYYNEKDFEGAIVAYENFLKKYPKNQKVPAALYKQALSFIEIGDKKSGKLILEQIIEKFPKSPEAEKAKKKLNEIDKQPAKKPILKKKKK